MSEKKLNAVAKSIFGSGVKKKLKEELKSALEEKEEDETSEEGESKEMQALEDALGTEKHKKKKK